MAPASTGGDDTALLQTWLDELDDSAAASFPANESYRVDGSLLMENRTGITIDGNGATLTATSTPDSGGAHLLLLGCDNITISNLTIIGENPDPGENGGGSLGNEGRHGISLRSCTFVTINNVTIQDVFADFVYLGIVSSDNPTDWCEDIDITNCTFSGNGRQGIGIVAARRVLIDSNSITDVRRACIDLEPNATTGGAENITISNNTTANVRLRWLASGGYGGSVSDIIVSNNTCTSGKMGVAVEPPTGTRRGPFTFTGNTATDPQDGPANGQIWGFLNCDGVTVTGNTVPAFEPTLTFVRTTGCTSVTVSGNTNVGAAAEWDDVP